MAELRQNTWLLNAWYEQDYAGNVEYTTSSNTLHSWGGNPVGGMGFPPANQYSSPQTIPGTTWSRARAGYRSGMATKSDGTLWGGGYNDDGALGHNNVKNYSSPMQVGSDTDWKQVSHGYQVSAAVKTDGTLWTWGANDTGQLGINVSWGNRSSPIQVPGAWEMVCVNNRHIYAVKADNTLFSLGGNNDYGELGQNTQGNPSRRSSPIQIPGTTWSNDIDDWGEIPQASETFVLTIKTDGTLWAWGNNQIGRCGQNEPTNSHKSSPVQIGGDNNWRNCGASGPGTGVATKTDGTLWAWGEGYQGQTGQNDNGHSARYSSPVQVGTGTNWKIAGGGGMCMGGVKTDGTLWTWGMGNDGGLGHNDKTQRSSPTQVPGTGWSSKFSEATNALMLKEL